MAKKTLGLMVGILVLYSTINCATQVTPTSVSTTFTPTSTATPTPTARPTASPTITALQWYVVQMGMVAASVDESFSTIGRLLGFEAYGDPAWRRDVLAPFDDIAESNRLARQIVPPTLLEEAHNRAISGYGLYVAAGALLSEVIAEAAEKGSADTSSMEEVSRLIELGGANLAFASALIQQAIDDLNVRGDK